MLLRVETGKIKVHSISIQCASARIIKGGTLVVGGDCSIFRMVYSKYAMKLVVKKMSKKGDKKRQGGIETTKNVVKSTSVLLNILRK